MHEHLAQLINSRNARVGVVGLGYVGLPLAVALAEAGFHVAGIDVDARKVAALRSGHSPIMDISDEQIAAMTAVGRIVADTTYAAVPDCDALFVCVPTPFDANKTPDLRAVHAAADSIGAALRPGQLVVLQSTTYPGTTEETIRPRLEAGGLKAGVDFFLAFSPERIDPGAPTHTVMNTPKVVGGLTPTCTQLAAALLGTLGTSVHTVSSPRVAEMTKLLENIFRSVNIALVNELALLCERMDIDVWEVISAAATKPFGFMPFRPSAGVGGHCIPIDPYYLAWKAREFDFTTRFIELAADINQGMPYHVVNLVSRWLDRHGRTMHGANVLLLGVAFKPEVEDPRHSPAERVIELLLERGAVVSYHDPYVPTFHVGNDVFHPTREELASVELTDAVLATADIVVIVTAHRVVDYDRVVAKAQRVVDTTNATGHLDAGHVLRLGAPAPRSAPTGAGPASAPEPALSAQSS